MRGSGRVAGDLRPARAGDVINVFFQRWLARLPLPLTAADRDGGYWWELSMAQVETSRTLVLTQPRYARGFFEALVADNLDLGRPDTIEIIFDRQIRGGKRATGGEFKTKVVTRGTEVTVNAFYKRSPDQAIPQRRARPADRDRDQRPQRRRLPTPPAQPRRPADQSACDQRPGVAG